MQVYVLFVLLSTYIQFQVILFLCFMFYDKLINTNFCELFLLLQSYKNFIILNSLSIMFTYSYVLSRTCMYLQCSFCILCNIILFCILLHTFQHYGLLLHTFPYYLLIFNPFVYFGILCNPFAYLCIFWNDMCGLKPPYWILF